MIQSTISSLLTLIITLPIFFIFKNSNTNPANRFFTIVFYHLIYVSLLFIPIEFNFLQVPGASLNWTGKILAILFSLSFYFYKKGNLGEYGFINSKPLKGSTKKVMLVGGITILFMCLLTFAFSNGKPLSIERLAYQFTMPGIDEELWRGILLGLIIPLIKNRKFKMGHPALWITSIIFALGHSLYLENWNFGFALDAFILTGILGYILGWTILKSRSILPALILHNLINFSTNFLEMIVL